MQSALTVLIIVPCCGATAALDAAALERSIERMPNVRFSLVDGSSAGMSEALQRVAARAPRAAHVVQLESCDEAEVTRRGILLAFSEEADLMGYCDIKLATECDALAKLVRALMQSDALDIVIGARAASPDRHGNRGQLRQHLRGVLARAASLVLNFPIHDIQHQACVFRVGPRTRALFGERFASRLLGVEVMARYLAGAGTPDRVLEVPLPCAEAEESPLEALDFARSLGELANIYRSYDLRQSFRPLVLAVTGVFSRYVGVGGIGTGAHYALLVTSVECLGLAPQFGAVLGASVGAIVNYFLNYTLTFASREAHRRALPKFALVALAGVLVSGYGVRTAGRWGVHYLWAQIMCTLFVLIGGFFLNRAWTFAARPRAGS